LIFAYSFTQVRLCREMLPESPGIDQDEILAEVVGFLEACQERLNDLIEAGSAGVLGENDMEMCFKVHEAVLKTLEAEKVPCFSPSPPLTHDWPQTGTQISVDDETTLLLSGNPQTFNGSEAKRSTAMKASLVRCPSAPLANRSLSSKKTMIHFRILL
jgi:hypothetical protein